MDSLQIITKEPLQNYKMYDIYKDSLINEANNKQIAQMKTQ